MGLNVLSFWPLMQTQSFPEAEIVSLKHAASAPFCFQLSPWILVLQSPGHFLKHLFPVFNFPGSGFYQRIPIDTPLSHRAASQPCLTITSLACPQNFKTGLLFTEVRHLCHEWPWSVVPMFKAHFNLSFLVTRSFAVLGFRSLLLSWDACRLPLIKLWTVSPLSFPSSPFSRDVLHIKFSNEN